MVYFDFDIPSQKFMHITRQWKEVVQTLLINKARISVSAYYFTLPRF